MVSQFGSLGYTIMGKTADLTVVQKTIIDTLHKGWQTFIAKEAGCSQSAVSKHVNRKLSGRKKCGRKRCTINRENRSLVRIVKQNRFKNFGELHKEWTEAGVKASEHHTQTCQGIWQLLSSEVLSRGKWETRDQKMQMSWRPLSKKPGLPYHLSSATNWAPPCHAELRQ